MNIPFFNDLKLIIVGDAMLDRYLHGDTSRISPEAPVPVIHVTQIEDKAGGAGNVALNVAAFGAQASIFSVCGKDEAGFSLKEKLENANVRVHIDFNSKVQTILKQRVLSLHQQLIRLDLETFYHDHDFSELIENLRIQIPNTHAVIFSDYGKGMRMIAPKIIALANQHKIPIIVDPKGVDFGFYCNATLLTPNVKEFEAVVGKLHSEDEMRSKAFSLIDSLNLQALLITRGAQGMSLFTKEASEFHVASEASEVYDVTGAGDTVAAVLAMSIAAGESLVNAVRLANAAGGIVVGKLGAATTNLSELAQAILPNNLVTRGVMTREDLISARHSAKIRGERVVMTNGCFDLLHAGHVAYLEEAKRLGDRLIVAVNDDSSVMGLKGKNRPMNTLAHRMAVLAGLAAVDWVVPFSEDTPQQLIADILPDVLAKGGDYREDEIAGAKNVLENGGEVKILQFIENCSTTKMIQKIQELA